MFRRIASNLTSKVRLTKDNFQLLRSRWSWSRNYAGLDINLGGQDRDAIKESFLLGGGASFLRKVKNSTCDMDEYGIKYLPVMRKAMYIEGRRVLKAGVDALCLKNGISLALDVVQKHLKCRARMVSTFEELVQVGTTAANGDRRMGELIAMAMEKYGKEGVFIISGTKNPKYELEFVNGMKLNWGSISPYFIDEKERICVLDNPFVLIHQNKILDRNIIKQGCLWTDYKRPLLIVAKDVDMAVGGSLVLDKACLKTKMCVVKPPEFEGNLKAVYEENLKGIMQDLAVLTGGRVITASSNTCLIPLMLGSCKGVTISDNEMIIHGGSGSLGNIQQRCEQLESAIKLGRSDYEIKLLEERLRKLSGGAAILKVCGASKAKVGRKNKRVMNALNAVKAAIEEGIVPGGGVALLHALKELDKLKIISTSEKIGVQLLQYALKMPLYAIASTSGFEGSDVVRRLLEQENPDLGFDPARGEYIDVIKYGIVDPLKHVIKELDDLKSDLDNDYWSSSKVQ